MIDISAEDDINLSQIFYGSDSDLGNYCPTDNFLVSGGMDTRDLTSQIKFLLLGIN